MIRSHLKTFVPYRSARSEVLDARVLLDANELSLGSPLSFDGRPLNRYPEPHQNVLRSKLAEWLGLTRDMVFVGVGSDEIIDLLIRLFCEPANDSMVILEPTYGVYRVAARLNAARTVQVELDDTFQIDLEKILQTVTSDTKMLFCCSPNNPTGNLLRREDVLSLCDNIRGIVVVDEAYIEFASTGSESPKHQVWRDLASTVLENENLVVLRTLSKAWGLAGIRLGYCVANPFIVSYLLRIKAPYNVSTIAAHFALCSLENEEFITRSTQIIREERERLRSELAKIPHVVRVFPSDANFLLVEFRNCEAVFESLRQHGIVVRRRSEARLQNCLRISVGTPTENNLVLQCLREMA